MGRHMVDVDPHDFKIFIIVSSAIVVFKSLDRLANFLFSGKILSTYSLIFFNAIYFIRLSVLLFIRRLLTICKPTPARV